MPNRQAGLVLATALAVLAGAQAQARPDDRDEYEQMDRGSGFPWLENPFPGIYVPPAPADLLIRDATILDGAGKRIDNGDVLLAEGKVVAIGEDVANPGGVAEIDGTGRWVTPGVIDVHSHDGTYVLPLTAIDWDAAILRSR